MKPLSREVTWCTFLIGLARGFKLLIGLTQEYTLFTQHCVMDFNWSAMVLGHWKSSILNALREFYHFYSFLFIIIFFYSFYFIYLFFFYLVKIISSSDLCIKRNGNDNTAILFHNKNLSVLNHKIDWYNLRKKNSKYYQLVIRFAVSAEKKTRKRREEKTIKPKKRTVTHSI